MTAAEHDDTKRDLKDEGYGLYPVMGVMSTGLFVWMRALFRGRLPSPSPKDSALDHSNNL